MPGPYRFEKWKEYYAPNAAMLRATLTADGYRVFQWADPPGMVYGLHSHGEDQSHWVISGALEITLELGGTFVLNAGDRDFMPAGTYHSARVLGEEQALYLIGEKLPERRRRGRPKKKPRATAAANDSALQDLINKFS